MVHVHIQDVFVKVLPMTYRQPKNTKSISYFFSRTAACEVNEFEVPVVIHVARVVLNKWTCRRFSPGSSTNKTDRHDITEILLKVALNTITLRLTLLLKDP
jgi:hypothetical protein